MFDTHAHLNFKRFKKNLDEVIKNSHLRGVSSIVVPGTDEKSSKRAAEIASSYEEVYAAVGIHPHHVFPEGKNSIQYPVSSIQEESKERIRSIEKLILNTEYSIPNTKNIVAIGEIGLDKHQYENTKYKKYHVDDSFINLQKDFFVKQIALAKKYNLSVIIHNREAKDDLLELLNTHWDNYYEGRMVFHCCEPDDDLLNFAKAHKIFIGVDGDVTYRKDKQEFIKKVPLEQLVLETDSPFLLPEPYRSRKEFPNTPANIPRIAECIANFLGKDAKEIKKVTEENGKRLFNL